MTDDRTPPGGDGGDQQVPENQAGGGAPQGPPPAQARKRRRRWPFVVIGLVVLLAVLVLLAPAILSTAWGRSIVVGRVNNNLNGRVQISDWSLSWTRGIEIHGLRVFQDEAQILEMNRLSTGLSLASLIRGKYDLGKTTVDGLDFVLKRYADGTTNFQRLMKHPSAEPMQLPNVRGEVQANFRGTIEQEGAPQAVIIDPSRMNLQIADINQPIPNQVEMTLRVGAGPAGKVRAEGVAKPFENNRVDLAHLTANQNITLQSVDLASLVPLMGPSAPIDKMQGQADGKLMAKVVGSEDVELSGQIMSRDVAASGPVLHGETYRTSQLTVTVPPTLVSRSTGRIRTGDGGGNQALQIQADQGQVAISADSTLEAIKNLLNNQKPGSAGRMQMVAELDVAKLAAQLPKTLGLQQGIRPESGRLRQVIKIDLSPEKAAINQQTDLTDLAATNASGLRVTAQPIHVKFEGISLGGGGAIPDLRDVVLEGQSGFGAINGKGQSLSQLVVDGNLNLATMQQELGQFVDFGQRQMAGEAKFHIATDGDLTRADGSAKVDANLVATNLQLAGWTEAPIKQPRLELTGKGNLIRSQEQFVQAIRNAAITLRTGDPQQPGTDLEAGGDIAIQSVPAGTKVTSPAFAINRCNVNLPAVQGELGSLLQPLRSRGVEFAQGTLSLQAAGSYDGTQTAVQSLKLTTADVTVQRRMQDGRVMPVLQKYSTTLEAAGSLRQDGEGLQAELSKLAWSDPGGILNVEEIGDGNLVVQLPQGGGFRANGKLRLAADLKAINDVLQSLSDRPIEATARNQAGELRSGRLAGTLQFARADRPETRLDGDFTLGDLSIATYDQPITNEKLTLTLHATAADDLSAINAQQVDVKSSFMNVAMRELALRNAEGAGMPAFSLDTVQKGNVTFDVPDLPRSMALIQAMFPREAKAVLAAGAAGRAPDGAAAAQELPPIAVRSGSLRGAIGVERTSKGISLNISELAGNRIIIDRGRGTFGPRSVALRAAALVVTNPPNAQAGQLEQIKEINVTELTGNTGLADVSLQEPIVARNLAGVMQVSGAVKLAGEVRVLANLLEALQGEPPELKYDYGGTYTALQQLRTQGDTVAASGQVDIANFAVGNPQQPAFSEKLVRLANDISVDQKAKDLVIRNLSLDMQTSKALTVTATGAIRDYVTARKLDNVRLVLGYDAAKVLALAKPLLSAERRKQMEDLQAAGVVSGREFLVTGSYPAGDPHEALKLVRAEGSLSLDRLEYEGFVAEKIDLPVAMADGVAKLAYAGKPQGQQYPSPIRLNGGNLDIGGLEVDLMGPSPRVSMPRPNVKVLDNVTLNKQMVASYLGRLHPLFTGAQEGRGVINANLVELSGVPLDLLSTPQGGTGGRGRLTFSITDLRLRAPFIDLLTQQIQVQMSPDQTIPGSIRDGVIAVENGTVRSDFGLDVGGQVLGFRDTVVQLSDRRIVSMTMTVPKAMIPVRQVREEKFIKDVISVPVTGYLGKPKFNIVEAAMKSVTIPQGPALLDLLRKDRKKKD